MADKEGFKDYKVVARENERLFLQSTGNHLIVVLAGKYSGASFVPYATPVSPNGYLSLAVGNTSEGAQIPTIEIGGEHKKVSCKVTLSGEIKFYTFSDEFLGSVQGTGAVNETVSFTAPEGAGLIHKLTFVSPIDSLISAHVSDISTS